MLVATLGAACTTAPVPSDAGATPLDAPDLDGGGTDAGHCDVAPVPADLPSIVGRFVPLVAAPDAGAPSDAGAIEGGVAADAGASDAGTSVDGGSVDGGSVDGGSVDGADAGLWPDVPPEPRGGDPVGTWRIDRATFYTAPSTAGMYDPDASSITGTAWVVATATDIRFEFDFDITLVTTIAGTIRRRQVTRVVAGYVVDGTSIMLTPTCAEGGGTGSGAMLSFTAEATRGVLITRITGMLGDTTIVLEGTREP